jgi:hypothetical protein
VALQRSIKRPRALSDTAARCSIWPPFGQFTPNTRTTSTAATPEKQESAPQDFDGWAAECSHVLFLRQPWNKKLHRRRAKVTQVEKTKCPAVVATSLDRPFGKFLFGFRFLCIHGVSHFSIPDHTAALLAPSSPIHCVCHLNPQYSELKGWPEPRRRERDDYPVPVALLKDATASSVLSNISNTFTSFVT